MTRASFLRRSPLLLLTVALAMLAVFFAPGAQPAQAQTTTVWSATLTVTDQTSGEFGCGIDGQSGRCEPSGALSDNTFTYTGSNYAIRGFVLSSGGVLRLTFSSGNPANLSSLTLHVGNSQFAFASAQRAGSQTGWTNTGLSWSVGDTIQLSLTEGSSTTTTTTETTTTETTTTKAVTTPQVVPGQARLPVDTSLHDEGTHAPYCYLGEGNGMTEFIRYPDGRIAETTRQSDAIRSMFACD